jgi:hypothetical protein
VATGTGKLGSAAARGAETSITARLVAVKCVRAAA